MAVQRGFRVLGFPVQIRPGFIFFLLLIVVVSGGSLGLWLAGAIAGFTLAHELGHAIAARATGAKAEIALDFLAGYASFMPTRRLKRWERAGIAFAGPAVQIVIGLAILTAMGVDPLSRSSVTDSPAAFAIWWAGPTIGLLNLLPVLPLDGGSIAAAGLDFVVPGKGQRIMSALSLPLTGAAVVLLILNDDLRPMAPFAAILLVFQLQALSASRPSSPAARQLETHKAYVMALNAERQAWQTGRPGLLQPGQSISPWFAAHQALQAGDEATAARIMVGDLTAPSGHSSSWLPPEAAPPRALEAITRVLPMPLPYGNPYAERVLVSVLNQLGEYDQAARYGADSYARSPNPATAIQVARGVAALGDAELARRWIATARDTDASGAALVDAALQAYPELAGVA
jgi:Zn-dependent protease